MVFNGKIFLLCIAVLLKTATHAQSVTDVGIALSATVQSNPDEIKLQWPAASSATQYQVYRMLKGQTSWGTPLASLPGNAVTYIDQAVQAGTSYEYRVVRSGPSYTGYGYINSGIEIPAVEFRGTVLLLVDSTMITALSAEIDRLVLDMEGDGWLVKRVDVDRNGSVYHVKDIVVAEQLADTSLKTVFILGHVPVPYSGNLAPDGHSDHAGAWPADCYYGDVNGTWTDNFVTSTTASPLRTQNIPGDGKFDQSVLPSPVELQVGRVDFANLPAFSNTETQLLKTYLDKDHEYRKKIYQAIKRAVVDDNFGYFSGEAFAASAYKNFGPLVSTASITPSDYFTSMASGSYQWSYGCGGGSYTSAGGIGSTSSFATSGLQGVFTMLFGSYFGDWDSQDNFLRAALAQGKMLCNVWSGRPHFQLHHMGLGEHIGYSIMLTQNNAGGIYFGSSTGIHGGYVHNALLGDPTLRNDVVAPVSNLVANKQGFHSVLNWSASNDAGVIGYHVYRKDSTNKYARLNGGPVALTSYTDHCLSAGIYTYLVRAVKLEITPSGSYYNMSEGVSDSAMATGYDVVAQFSQAVNGNTLTLQNLSSNATNYSWSSAGVTSTVSAPVITYTANGSYIVFLKAFNTCDADSVSDTVEVCHWLPQAQFTASVTGDTVIFNAGLVNVTQVFWNFGNGSTSTLTNPVVHYPYPGTYTVYLYASNECAADTFLMEITVLDVGLGEQSGFSRIVSYPNPASDQVFVKGITGRYEIYSSSGMLVQEGVLNEAPINVEALRAGIYLLNVKSGGNLYTRKIVIEK